jgi:hypothetical protein
LEYQNDGRKSACKWLLQSCENKSNKFKIKRDTQKKGFPLVIFFIFFS